MPLEQLDNETTARWPHQRRDLPLVGEFDRREGWSEWGYKSCADWLSVGLGLKVARPFLVNSHAYDGSLCTSNERPPRSRSTPLGQSRGVRARRPSAPVSARGDLPPRRRHRLLGGEEPPQS